MTRSLSSAGSPPARRTMGAMPPTRASTWEYREIHLPRGTARDAARSALTELAEHGSWELARLRLYPDGRRRVWLRRKILRAVRTA
ncbi:unannotated protein [freshwater metagenome]|uniref:Unannotated protein n=1 Tax=freshwater metagenome TaxID=449393 RepID=A0A6J7BPV4_9ZZZZ